MMHVSNTLTLSPGFLVKPRDLRDYRHALSSVVAPE